MDEYEYRMDLHPAKASITVADRTKDTLQKMLRYKTTPQNT